ncbi:MAG: shikimate dehydrogenase [Gammaproteobacteria bacterium]|nr:shikimate dehydrogenase [Gammaproteobacteria bacterium]MDH5302873.1 shikimate dehydrogenase [Gammaproteobacteria bacterium]MDH5320978.1 shikimate dehydrogenase [Gammaproteobacteria bacterium]
MGTRKHPSILVGLIGAGIGGSLSPAMHEHEGDMHGMRYQYKFIDLDKLNLDLGDLPELLLAAERMGFNGLNITYPCKQAVVQHLHELSDAAARIGAVNTVVFSNGRRVGHNTDAWGFFESFNEAIASHCEHDEILLLGAGGAGAAISHALLGKTNCSLEIFDTDPSRASGLVESLADVYGNGRAVASRDTADSVSRVNGVINATPVGMTRSPGYPIEPGLLRSDLWVADIVYFPIETKLVRAANDAGCTVMNGGGMAVFQAARAFEIFTGVRPDIKRMKAHFNTLV